MQIFTPHFRAGGFVEEHDVVGVASGRLHLAAHEQRILMRDEQLAVEWDLPASRRGP